MTRYEQAFDTEWETLGIDDATDRAYAIGVATQFDEDNRAELDAIYDEMNSTYERSIVELAYQAGRNEAEGRRDSTSDDELWAALVTDEGPHTADDDGDAHESTPIVDTSTLLKRSTVNSTDAVSLPDFLER